MRSCYLSGPITGKKYGEAQNWRTRVAERLSAAGIESRDPLRGKSYLSHQRGPLDDHKYQIKRNPTLSDKALKRRDVLDVINSDIILVNFEDATRVSIGTVFEIAIADYLNKLIVMVVPDKDQIDQLELCTRCYRAGDHPHNHAFLRDSAVVFENLDSAVAYVISCAVSDIEKDY